MPDWARILIAIGIVVALTGLMILGYVLNKRTPKPEGCIDAEQQCSSCTVDSCAFNKNPDVKEEDKK